LHIDIRGVEFRSADGKTSILIPMKDLRDVSVADPYALRFGTYEALKWKPVERIEDTFRGAPDTSVESWGSFLQLMFTGRSWGIIPKSPNSKPLGTTACERERVEC
jgi:hypothetical protein